jgi:hypothetical protein
MYLKHKPIISLRTLTLLKKLLLQHTGYKQKKSQNLHGKTVKRKQIFHRRGEHINEDKW